VAFRNWYVPWLTLPEGTVLRVGWKYWLMYWAIVMAAILPMRYILLAHIARSAALFQKEPRLTQSLDSSV